MMLYPSVNINAIHASFQKLLSVNQKWDAVCDTDKDGHIDMIPMCLPCFTGNTMKRIEGIYCKSGNFPGNLIFEKSVKIHIYDVKIMTRT